MNEGMRNLTPEELNNVAGGLSGMSFFNIAPIVSQLHCNPLASTVIAGQVIYLTGQPTGCPSDYDDQ
jgi:hypothetical protein